MGKERKYKKYKRLTSYQKELIHKMHEEKMELKKIARVIGANCCYRRKEKKLV